MDELRLGTRPYNAMMRHGVRSVEQLLALTEEQIFQWRNIGQGSLAEIREALAWWRPGTRLAPEQLDLDIPTVVMWIEEAGLPTFLSQDWRPIQALGLLPRSMNCLLSHGIRTIGELCGLSTRELLNLRGLGAKAWEDVRASMARHAAGGPPPPMPAPPPAPTPVTPPTPRQPSVAELIQLWLKGLDERSREMVCLHFGLGCASETMQQMADRWGITRARVEQIVNHKATRHLRKIAGGAPLHRHLQALRDYVAQRDGLVSAPELRQDLANHLDIGDMDPILACQILAAADDGLDWMESIGALHDETLSLKLIAAVRREARRLLAEMGDEASVSRLLLLLRQSRVCIEQGDALTDATLVACLRTDSAFEIADDTIRYGRCLPDLVERILAALREIGAPAHFTEITAQVNTTLPAYEPAADHNIHATMQRHRDLFTRVGRGRYGLVEWGLPADGCVADAIARVLAEAGAPLTSAEITERVLETWQVNPGTVYAALNLDPRFVVSGKGRYALV